MAALKSMISRIVGEEATVNQYYGHDAVLKQYAGVRLPYVTPGEIQHGWHADTGIYGDLTQHSDTDRRFPYYVWNRHNLQRSRDRGYSNTVAIGAPFLYLRAAPASPAPELGEKSLLLFPFHTWEREPFLDPLRTYRNYLEEIRDLLSSFRPVTVCLYWIQYDNRDIVRLFEDSGLQAVTLGNRDRNPLFLHKFHRLADRHAYVSSNAVSTAVFYALYMRKKVFLFGRPPYSEVQWLQTSQHPGQADYSAVYPQLTWKGFGDQSHYGIGETELGLEFKRTPADLRRIFGWNAASWTRGCSRRALLEMAAAVKSAPPRVRQTLGALTGRGGGHGG